jgi:hypothetical protein
MNVRDGQAILLVLASLAAGCFVAPSLQGLSAGRVGCAPSDITISAENDQSGSRTWIATCGDRSYQCSNTSIPTSAVAVSSTGQVGTAFGSQSDIACAPLGGGSPSGSSRSGAKGTPGGKEERAGDTAGTEGWQPLLDPPDSAGGFMLGSDPQAASKLCTEAGKAWEESGESLSRCSGTPVDLGFRASSRLKFCDGSLCGSRWSSPSKTWIGPSGRASTRRSGAPSPASTDRPRRERKTSPPSAGTACPSVSTEEPLRWSPNGPGAAANPSGWRWAASRGSCASASSTAAAARL